MTKEQFITFKEDLKKSIEMVKLENKWTKQWWNCGFKTEDEYKAANAERWNKYDEIRKSIVCRVDDVKWSFEEHKYIPTGQTSPAIGAEYYSTHQAYYIAKHQLNDEEAIEYLNKEYSKMKAYRGKTDAQIDAKYWYKKIKEGILACYENLDVKSE